MRGKVLSLGHPSFFTPFSDIINLMNTTNNRKALILGSTGFLGSAIVKLVPEKNDLWLAYKDKQIEVGGFKSIKINLLDYQSLADSLNEIKPNAVIHVARIDPDDENPERAKEAIEQLVKSIKRIGAKLIYISSDAVFNGIKGNYKEGDETNPITDYGRAKLAAEIVIRKSLKNFIIIRTSYIYGKGATGWDKRTAPLLNQIRQGKVVHRFEDMYRSPIQVADIAKAIWRLIEKDFNGIVHVAGKRKNIYEFSKELIKEIGMDSNFVKPDSLTNKNLNIAPDTSLNTDLFKKLINNSKLSSTPFLVSFKN